MNIQKKDYFGFIVMEQLKQAAAKESPEFTPLNSLPLPSQRPNLNLRNLPKAQAMQSFWRVMSITYRRESRKQRLTKDQRASSCSTMTQQTGQDGFWTSLKNKHKHKKKEILKGPQQRYLGQAVWEENNICELWDSWRAARMNSTCKAWSNPYECPTHQGKGKSRREHVSALTLKSLLSGFTKQNINYMI